MKQRYQYRIYPNIQQARSLAKLFGCCRVVWNDSLALSCSTSKLHFLCGRDAHPTRTLSNCDCVV
ncbi:helix-turn-helix domain-containing protein [Microcoleus sp. A003_D6]|uniref:helix-turn-helix domain-containing protein n=1 Tax=Microcoleus sp. A003_D6 TaxID=3055266 RepID=UPI003FA5A779